MLLPEHAPHLGCRHRLLHTTRRVVDCFLINSPSFVFVSPCARVKAASEPQTIQPEPEFGSTMDNITVAKGRDASFTCVVLNLGSHRVRHFLPPECPVRLNDDDTADGSRFKCKRLFKSTDGNFNNDCHPPICVSTLFTA